MVSAIEELQTYVDEHPLGDIDAAITIASDQAIGSIAYYKTVEHDVLDMVTLYSLAAKAERLEREAVAASAVANRLASIYALIERGIAEGRISGGLSWLKACIKELDAKEGATL